MEYINVYNSTYKRLVKNGYIKPKILLIGWNGEVIDDITDICDLPSGSLSIKMGESRYSGSIRVLMSKLDYSLELKCIKALIGVSDGTDTYYMSFGVMPIAGISKDGEYLVLDLCDKFDVLSGKLKLGFTSAQLQIPSSSKLDLLDESSIASGKGIKIGSCIRDILSTKIGNGLLLDPITPLIDKEFDDISLEKQIVIGAGFYPAAAIKELTAAYMYDSYYDGDGHLRVERNLSDDYYYLAPQWEFTDNDMSDLTAEDDTTEYINAQRVTGTDIGGKVYSYTAYNNNPRSPLRTSLIGIRRAPDVEISNGGSTRRCEMYAKYLLKHKTASAIRISFNSYILPHILANRPIMVSSITSGMEREKYIVDSATIPLGGGSMNISASKIEYLPFEEGDYE